MPIPARAKAATQSVIAPSLIAARTRTSATPRRIAGCSLLMLAVSATSSFFSANGAQG
jgi:hypothetical protein